LSQVIQIERLVDEQRFGRFGLNLLVLSFLAMFADGYDITAMVFAAPQPARSGTFPPRTSAGAERQPGRASRSALRCSAGSAIAARRSAILIGLVFA
jgi:hypothetical protein